MRRHHKCSVQVERDIKDTENKNNNVKIVPEAREVSPTNFDNLKNFLYNVVANKYVVDKFKSQNNVVPSIHISEEMVFINFKSYLKIPDQFHSHVF